MVIEVMKELQMPKDEKQDIAHLMETFHQVTDKLQATYEKIIAEKDELIAKKTRLEVLGELGASLAHEIRNPLTGIQNYASMLRKDVETDPQKTMIIDKILHCVTDLEKLVESILDYTRTFNPEKANHLSPLIIQEALSLAQEQIRAKDINVIDGFSKGNISINADAAMLKRVFLNLILNAVEASGQGGQLKISVRTDEENIYADFQDNGKGMLQEHLHKIFTPFFTTKSKGTGLGLSIASKIVESHGGNLRADNVKGGGAVFTVRLPKNGK